MKKEIIFRDEWTLNGTEDMSAVYRLMKEVGTIGEQAFGLQLELFNYADAIHFYWKGRKRDIIKFYIHLSKEYYKESLKVRLKTILKLLKKRGAE